MPSFNILFFIKHFSFSAIQKESVVIALKHARWHCFTLTAYYKDVLFQYITVKFPLKLNSLDEIKLLN